MGENDYVGDHVNPMKLIAKELANASHPMSDKMQGTTMLNSLPLSWEHFDIVIRQTYKNRAKNIIELLDENKQENHNSLMKITQKMKLNCIRSSSINHHWEHICPIASIVFALERYS